LKQNSVSFTSYSSKHREQQAFICLLMMVVTHHLMKSEVLIIARSTQSPQPGVYREIVPPTKFSKICLVVSYNNKLQSFCFPENISLLRPCSPSWTFTQHGMSEVIRCMEKTRCCEKLVAKLEWVEI